MRMGTGERREKNELGRLKNNLLVRRNMEEQSNIDAGVGRLKSSVNKCVSLYPAQTHLIESIRVRVRVQRGKGGSGGLNFQPESPTPVAGISLSSKQHLQTLFALHPFPLQHKLLQFKESYTFSCLKTLYMAAKLSRKLVLPIRIKDYLASYQLCILID
ncbi:hypothetical protein M9H77_06865 [Catharanthus roseus]|uniref:Uncharacterized protein n=1 Tax=Catharanthus roseus TaxID=4058 RepID=A0ACC0BTF8_CATRO|nr:hypothetical protein M9H77_06865 [Catharanthus roseus]